MKKGLFVLVFALILIGLVSANDMILSLESDNVKATIPAVAYLGGEGLEIKQTSEDYGNIYFGANLGRVVSAFSFGPDSVKFYYPVSLVLETNCNLGRACENLKIYTKENYGEWEALKTSCSTVNGEYACKTNEALHTGRYVVAAPIDSDEDGVYDSWDGEIDSCPMISGSLSRQGCSYGSLGRATIYNINIESGVYDKTPQQGAEIRVFDRNSDAFIKVAGSELSYDEYGIIFESGAGIIGRCFTNSQGECTVGEEYVGEFLVVAKYSKNGENAYVGVTEKQKDFAKGIAEKDFYAMKIYDGEFETLRGASKVLILGTTGEIIAPSSSVWYRSRMMYPFIFDLNNGVSADVCADSDIGISGVYDSSGNLVPHSNCVRVESSEKMAAFEISGDNSKPVLNARIKLSGGSSFSYNLEVRDISKDLFDEKVKAARSIVQDAGGQGEGITGRVVSESSRNYWDVVLIAAVVIIAGYFIYRKTRRPVY